MVRSGLLRQVEVTPGCLDVYSVFWAVLQSRQNNAAGDESYPNRASKQTLLSWYKWKKVKEGLEQRNKSYYSMLPTHQVAAGVALSSRGPRYLTYRLQSAWAGINPPERITDPSLRLSINSRCTLAQQHHCTCGTPLLSFRSPNPTFILLRRLAKPQKPKKTLSEFQNGS